MDILDKLFSEIKIEYFSVLSYSDCIETSPSIKSRSGFEPKSVIIYLLPYYTGDCVNISRYAASLDYHIAIREVGEKIISALKSRYPENSFRSFGDHSPINECHAALVSGLGIAGDNGLLINEKYGSYIFIGDVITDIPPELLSANPPVPVIRCEGCGACSRACPTGILRGEGEECLSAITQRKGDLSDAEAALMRKINTAWGCDLCQSSCPHNRTPEKTPLEFFYRDRIPYLTSERLSEMNDEEFEMRAFAWRKRRTVERNLKILESES